MGEVASITINNVDIDSMRIRISQEKKMLASMFCVRRTLWMKKSNLSAGIRI